MCYRCSKGWGGTQQVRLVCFTAGAFADDAMAMGIDTLVLDSGVRSSIRTLTGMIQNEHFDIVHCHGSRANMIGAILKRTIKVPIVTTVHSDYRLDYLGRPFHRLTYGTINTVALRMFDYHIGVSDAMVQLLISRGFDPQKLFSIYNGVDFPPKPANLSRAEYLESLSITFDADTVVFGIAARLNPVKDIATLIRGLRARAKPAPIFGSLSQATARSGRCWSSWQRNPAPKARSSLQAGSGTRTAFITPSTSIC